MELPLLPVQRRSRGLTVVHSTLDAITTLKDWVPSEAAKALSCLAGFLELLKTYMINQEDLSDLAQRCHRIGLVLWKGYKDENASTDHAALSAIIADLDDYVAGIHLSAEKKYKCSPALKLLTISRDKEEIVRWKQALDHFLHVFNAELNIATNMSLNEMSAMMREAQDARRKKQNPQDEYTSPLPMPRIFFGRCDMIKTIVETILHGEHVALIGPGGIGKSSVAKALLHEQAIIKTFCSSRYFVTYDGVSALTMSYQVFIDRIVEAFGLALRTSRAILAHLRQLANTLLILDNAETFLEAAGEDVGRIAEVIAELGNIPSLRIVLTTRSRNLPSNFSPCALIPVEGLDADSARQAFAAVYKQEALNASVDNLLLDLDCHPLSINLLAHIGSQSQWSVQRLEEEWNAQHTRILHTGAQKLQSLSVIINLSLRSPSFRGHEEVSLELLRTVAFFSQGIRLDNLPRLFPSGIDIRLIADSLNRCSLTYTRDASLIMLAPIRMYVKDIYNTDLKYDDPILTRIRGYYIGQLQRDAWYSARYSYTHVERILAFDLASRAFLEQSNICLTTLRDTSLFLTALFHHNPQSSELVLSLVSAASLPEPRWHNPLASRRKDTIVAKATCLINAGCLAYTIGNYHSALFALGAAKVFCQRHHAQCSSMLPLCFDLCGRMHMRQGRLDLADANLHESFAAQQQPRDPVWEAELSLALAWLEIRRGQTLEAKARVLKAESFYKSRHLVAGTVDALYCLAQIATEGGNLSAAKRYVKDAIQVSDEQEQPVRKYDLIRNLADIVGRQGKFAEANAILEGISGTARVRDVTLSLQSRAWNEARLGEYKKARVLITQAADAVATDQGRHLSSSSSIVAGYIELFAGDTTRATEILRALEVSLDDDGPDRRLRAWTLRALGELDILQGDFYAAKEHFQMVWTICEMMGVAPEWLYTCAWLHDTLPDSYNGWITFLEGDL